MLVTSTVHGAVVVNVNGARPRRVASGTVVSKGVPVVEGAGRQSGPTISTSSSGGGLSTPQNTVTFVGSPATAPKPSDGPNLPVYVIASRFFTVPPMGHVTVWTIAGSVLTPEART